MKIYVILKFYFRAQSYGSVYPVPGYGPPPRMYTRSATSTPISSPKRRLLPKIPVSVSPALRERIAHVRLILFSPVMCL